MRDQQPFPRADHAHRPGEASHDNATDNIDTDSGRAAAQLDRLVDSNHEVQQLVEGLALDNDGDNDRAEGPIEPAADAAPASRAHLRAMSPPPHDPGQIDQMANSAARMGPSRSRRARWRGWGALWGWLTGRR